MYPIEQNTDKTMQFMGNQIKTMIGPNYGFALIIVPFSAIDGVGHYVSDADRDDIIKVLRQQADNLESGQDLSNIEHSA